MPPVLVGSRCALRGLVTGDAPSIALHANDEGVWRNLFDGFPHPYTLADAQAWCDQGHRSPAVGQVWAITVDDQAIGCCGVRPDSGWLACNAEVGYWIGRAFWRRGIASDALALISNWALDSMPAVMRLYAPIFGWNEGSQAVARRCGYQLEARMPVSALKAGQLIDRVLYARYRPGATGGMPTLRT
jgi:[ribosomal protein S5]-alanine N-acetyltransferase